ncbi:hypothetical protein AALO_G00074220 [Alosa alosa]|uniref:G-protein coupled receptors family 1 profile domain-containing protein n=1 Tax=Alosa alosa TaxID=278164 RepID=A0AAV6H4R3_9TELE|nr:hypothetical protein AALO_G00074220 [Alosa alosa]
MEPTVEYPDSYDYYDDNETACDFSEWEPSYSLIPVLYMLIFILGLSGNGLVIFTVWRAKAKRRAADVYICNLALADLTFVITLPLWAVYTALGYHWPFGVALCKISSYVVLVNIGHLRSRDTIVASLGGIWLLSGMLALPTLLFRTTLDDEASNRTTCAMDFSLVAPNQRHESLWIAGLSLSSSALGFLLPFLAMTVFYVFIGCTVTRHFSQLRKEDQKKRRLLKIITTLVVVFALCWTPFHVLKSMDALSYLDLAPTSCSFLHFLLLAHPYATCLAYVNSCLNPFLYAFFDLRFRSQCLCLLSLKKAVHGHMSSVSSTLSAQTQKLVQWLHAKV